jgi:hypothetical protein
MELWSVGVVEYRSTNYETYATYATYATQECNADFTPKPHILISS